MRLNHSILLLVLFSMAFTLSCKRDDPTDVYQVPASIQPYIDDFIAEAQERGVTIERNSLIVTFEENLAGGNAAGTCTFRTSETAPHVRLDTTSFNWRNNLSSREQLIFHELGHCYLDRRHREDRMPNGEYKSLMRGVGEQVYGDALWAFKREAYLDELFNTTVEDPVWARSTASYVDFSALPRTNVLVDEFVDNRFQWNTGNNAQVRAAISGGTYQFESKSAGTAFFTARNLALDTTRNFSIELSLRLTGGDGPGMFQWGGNDPSNFFFIGTAVDSTQFGGNWETGADLIRKGAFNPGSFTKLTLWRQDGSYFFFVNEQYVTVFEFVPFKGTQIGFYIGGASAMEIDYLRIHYLD